MGIAGQTFRKLLVSEDAFDCGLRIIEIALDRTHVHVGTGLRGHLQLLHLADFAFRIEHGDTSARRIGEAGEGRLAGVSGGGGDDHDLLVAIIVGRSGACHEARQDLQGHILERGGRSVEQLHHEIVAERLDRSDSLIGPLRPVRLRNAFLQFVLGEIRQQYGQHVKRDLLVGLAGQGRDVHMGFAQGVGDEQAAVIGYALANGLLGGERVGGTACAVERGHWTSLAIRRIEVNTPPV